MKDTEEKFLSEIKEHLDQSVDNLDGATRSRLNRMRHLALEQRQPKANRFRNWLWAGGAALPALALGILIYFGLPNQQGSDVQPPQVASHVEQPPQVTVAAIHNLPEDLDLDDLEILLDDDDLDMLTDLEFLTWVNSQEEVEG